MLVVRGRAWEGASGGLERKRDSFSYPAHLLSWKEVGAMALGWGGGGRGHREGGSRGLLSLLPCWLAGEGWGRQTPGYQK